MNPRAGLLFRSIICAIVLGGGNAAYSQCGFCDDAPAVTEDTLSEVRGGFETPEGLRASFTLTRAAFVNGERVADLRVDIPDIGRMTSAQADALARAAGTLLIQSGVDNTADLGGIGLGSTVIQNTLSDVHLATLTTLDVHVNSLGAFRELNFQQGLHQTLGLVGGMR